MAITPQYPDESNDSFLNRLGLMSHSARQNNESYESLTWENIVDSWPPEAHRASPFSSVLAKRDANSECEFEFNSYSGSDVAVYLLFDSGDAKKSEDREFCPFREIQTLSISSARSVHPVRRLGESHVVEYTRGARTIAGSMVCVSSSKDPFAKYSAKSIREKASDQPFFTDELPNFSVLILASDEYGNVSHAALSDVTLTNFGQTFSVDDLYLENTYTYVARYFHPLLPDPSVLNKMARRHTSQKLSRNFVRPRGPQVAPGVSGNFWVGEDTRRSIAGLDPWNANEILSDLEMEQMKDWVSKKTTKNLNFRFDMTNGVR